MVKPAYLFFAFLTFLIFIGILIAFVALPDNAARLTVATAPSPIALGLAGSRVANAVGVRPSARARRSRHRPRRGRGAVPCARSRVARR